MDNKDGSGIIYSNQNDTSRYSEDMFLGTMSHQQRANWFLNECTLGKYGCPLDRSFYDYVPSLAMNTLLLVLFALSGITFCIQGFRTKSWTTFTVAMVLGCINEIIGYVSRILCHNNPFKINPFLSQICSLTIAPAFFALGIYLCLTCLICVYSPLISRLPPLLYTRFLIACDVISLLLQGTGGALASIAATKGTQDSPYAWRVGNNGDRLEIRFEGFLAALAVAMVAVIVRSVYRLIELSQRWEGELVSKLYTYYRDPGVGVFVVIVNDEDNWRNYTEVKRHFFVLEGLMVIVAVLLLNLFHPGMIIGDAVIPQGNEKDAADQGSDGVFQNA
ncbi:RTA1 like protein-domain-containing protein [Pyronema domesticum]|nr:RTA1 like protein-domain-containing protein [Pyronema domesticum]